MPLKNMIQLYQRHILYKDENGFLYCWYKKLGFETIDNWKIISGNINEIVHKL